MVCRKSVILKVYFSSFFSPGFAPYFRMSVKQKEYLMASFHLVSKTPHMSRIMRKPAICICENKGADQLRSNCEADQRLCFRYTVPFFYFLNPKFPVSSHLLCLYSLVYVQPVCKPHCWFSHDTAHIINQ